MINENTIKILNTIKGGKEAISQHLLDVNAIEGFLAKFPDKTNVIEALIDWINHSEQNLKVDKFIDFVLSFNADAISNNALEYIFGTIDNCLILLNVLYIPTGKNKITFDYQYYNKVINNDFVKAMVEYFADSYNFSLGSVSTEDWIKLRHVFEDLKKTGNYTIERFNELRAIYNVEDPVTHSYRSWMPPVKKLF